MGRIKVLTDIMTLAGFCPGEPATPPAVLVRTRARTPGGVERSFAQKVLVPDPDLFERLRQGVSPGDTIEITTATDWGAPGLPTTLVSFQKVESAAPEEEATRAAVR
jgi:hypothetical protein